MGSIHKLPLKKLHLISTYVSLATITINTN
jgi:hypothetical protein